VIVLLSITIFDDGAVVPDVQVMIASEWTPGAGKNDEKLLLLTLSFVTWA
jgi:hypothetical protein